MNKDRKDIEKNILSDYTEDIFSQRENDEFHISVRYERELMDAVKMGDIERLKTISLEKYHGNVGDYEGNICIETDDGWIFWNAEGKWEKVTV